MRNSKTRSKTIKCKLNKCKNIFYAYSALQFEYGKQLDRRDDIVEIKTNVRLKGFSLGDSYTTDFYCIKSDGSIMVRECVFKDKLFKPLTAKMLDCSRNFWLSNKIENWGIVIGNERITEKR